MPIVIIVLITYNNKDYKIYDAIYIVYILYPIHLYVPLSFIFLRMSYV